MSDSYKKYQSTIAMVCKQENTAAHGVCISLSFESGAVYNFNVWTIDRTRGMLSMRLAAEHTSPARLAAHVRGFIENTLQVM